MAVGCGGSDNQAQSTSVGAERGRCYPNGTCDSGLVCASNRCVRAPGTGGASSGDGSVPVNGGGDAALSAGGAVPTSGGAAGGGGLQATGGEPGTGGMLGGGGSSATGGVPNGDGGGEVCDPACTGEGLTCCRGTCVRIANDPFNCGFCGNACTGSAPLCADGNCIVPPCSDPSMCLTALSTCCGTACCVPGALCCESDLGLGPGLRCFLPEETGGTCP